MGSQAALKLPGAETPLIGCSFSGAREGEREQSCARSHDCDKLRSVSHRRCAWNLQRQAAKLNTALAQMQLLSMSVYLFSFVLQMTRLPTGTLPETERRTRLPASHSLCFIIFAYFASFPHRRRYAKRLNDFTLPSSGTRRPDPVSTRVGLFRKTPDSGCWREKGSAAPGTRLRRLILTGDGCR